MITNLKQIRRENLATLIKEQGGTSALGRAIETNPSYISQIMSEKNPGVVGERFARHIERGLNLETGWMDTDHADGTASGAPVATDADIRALAQGEKFMPTDSRERIPTGRGLSMRAFAFFQKSDDMQPLVLSSAHVVVEPEMRPEPGQIVVVSSPAGAFLRQYVRNVDGSAIFMAANPLYPSAAETADMKIAGVVVEQYKRMI